ncbi:MAG: hypothetical protein HW405_954 [Candidatus Berkelbacteria bacterium]|nr:hypothetical protein [Candidatus Berkelbacteria bacterium]
MPFYEKFIGRSDVFFAPSFFEINAGLKIPQVVTIHDLTTFIYPEHRGIEVSKRLSTCAKEAAKLSQKIITMSRATAADAQKYLNIKEKKIDVVYPGLSDLGKPNNLAKNLKPSSFILYVGTIEPRKNLIGLFKAYSLLPLVLQEKYPLVVVGAQGWNTGESYDAFNALKLEGKVKFLGFISDASLAKLYESCAVFVYPSLYEGFGLPVLEALSFGAPVVTSNISSLPEVAGDAAVLINPEDPKEICAGIQKLLEHNHEAMDIRQKGKIQSRKFTWEKSARETLKVLKEAAI